MTWQLFTAISVLCLSISIVLQRVLIHKDKIDPVAYAVFFQGLVGGIVTIFALVQGFTLPHISSYLLPAIAAVGMFGAGHIVYAKTLQRVEASIFSIYFATHAIWIMLLGLLFFDERLTLLQAIGALLIFVSISLVVRSFRNFRADAGALLGLATGLLFGLALTCWSYVGRHTDTLSWVAVSFVAASLAALLFSPKAVGKMKSIFSQKVLPIMALLGLFYAFGSIALLEAYKTGTFSLVSPLRQTGVIVTGILALLLLRSERVGIPRKIIASVVCTVGVVLLVM